MLLVVLKPDIHSHIDPENLEKYSLGRTTPDETARVEEHLLVCEHCRRTLEDSDGFGRAMTTAAGRWNRSGAKSWSKVSVLATAACLLLAASVALRWSGGGATPLAVNLTALRANHGAAAPAGRALELHPDLTGLPTSSAFRIELVDQAGKPVWSGELGAAQTAVMAPAQPAGAYFVRLYTTSGELVREYGLQIGG